MNRNTIIALAIGLLVGVFIGYEAGQGTAPAPAVSAPPMGPGLPAGGMPPGGTAEFQARISTLQQVVAKDPKNVTAWIQLGNDFFDTKQPQKAAEAYGRALELDPRNPNVLTDQGVMFRDLGQFDKAVANFKKANEIDPGHIQSLFNMGVVYAHDLHEHAKAIEAWNKVIQIQPQSPQAAEAKRGIQELNAQAPAAPPR